MPRKPQRGLPKKSTVLQLRKDVYAQLKDLQSDFKSFSQLIEVMTFWVHDLYAEEGIMIVYTLRDIARPKKNGIESLTAKAETRRAHVTIDQEAIAFLKMLSMRYPQAFPGPSQAANACALYVLQHCRDFNAKKHLLRRLEQVRNKHLGS